MIEDTGHHTSNFENPRTESTSQQPKNRIQTTEDTARKRKRDSEDALIETLTLRLNEKLRNKHQNNPLPPQMKISCFYCLSWESSRKFQRISN